MNNLRVCTGLDGSIPTAPTSFLFDCTGLAKSARQQKAAIRAKSVGRSHMKLTARMASRPIILALALHIPIARRKVAKSRLVAASASRPPRGPWVRFPAGTVDLKNLVPIPRSA